MTKIDQPITHVEVVTSPSQPSVNAPVERPERLNGATYKLTSPLVEAPLYVTINNDKDDKPHEIFFNSSALEHYQWVVALARMISLALQLGAPIATITKQLKTIHDPKGGMFKYGKYCPSFVAVIGELINHHVENTAATSSSLPTPFSTPGLTTTSAKSITDKELDLAFKGSLCPTCGEYAVTQSGGCATCAACGYSKCS